MAATHLQLVLCACLSTCCCSLSVCLSVRPSVRLCVYVCVYVCVSTKQMLVDVIRCQKSGDNLVDILKQRVTDDEVCV